MTGLEVYPGMTANAQAFVAQASPLIAVVLGFMAFGVLLAVADHVVRVRARKLAGGVAGSVRVRSVSRMEARRVAKGRGSGSGSIARSVAEPGKDNGPAKKKGGG